jgi:aerobic C4-dicarboxylate transport protein
MRADYVAPSGQSERALTDEAAANSAVAAKTPLHRQLYPQVLAAIALGVLFGWLAPEYADRDWVRALGEGFVKLI